jgi:GH35 family endo-1,4-beta-xylanase
MPRRTRWWPFAQAHAMRVRGHNLVWQEQLPGWITHRLLPWTPADLNRVLASHIANVVGHYKGRVYAWDVVNEPFNDDGTMRSTVWYNSPGIGFAGQGTRTIEQALRWAHAADPAARLFVNEIGAEVLNRKSNAVYAMAKDFVKRGVPLFVSGLSSISAPASTSSTTSTRSTGMFDDSPRSGLKCSSPRWMSVCRTTMPPICPCRLRTIKTC